MFHPEEERTVWKILDFYDTHTDNTPLILHFAEGDSCICTLLTAYESDNGLDTDEEGYDEYFEIIMAVTRTLVPGPHVTAGASTIAVRYNNFPTRIETESGDVIYSRKAKERTSIADSRHGSTKA